MEEDKKKAGEKIATTQPAKIKKGLQQNTQGDPKSQGGKGILYLFNQ